MKLSLEELLQSTQILQAGCLMGQGIPTYLRLLQQLITSPNMSTPAPMLQWWVGQTLTHQRWLGRISPTKVPLHFREEVKAGLESDVKKGVLERVPVGEADSWCSRMVIQPKKNGRPRRTVGLSGLSRVGRHESHPPGLQQT
jgi:hypothetical protein